MTDRLIGDLLVFNDSQHFDQQLRILLGEIMRVLKVSMNDLFMELLLKLTDCAEVLFDAGQLLLVCLVFAGLYLVKEAGAHVIHDLDLLIDGKYLLLVTKFLLELLHVCLHI